MIGNAFHFLSVHRMYLNAVKTYRIIPRFLLQKSYIVEIHGQYAFHDG